MNEESIWPSRAGKRRIPLIANHKVLRQGVQYWQRSIGEEFHNLGTIGSLRKWISAREVIDETRILFGELGQRMFKFVLRVIIKCATGTGDLLVGISIRISVRADRLSCLGNTVKALYRSR